MSKHGQQLAANDLLTVSEVANLLRVDSTTVRRWIKNGILEALSLPHVGSRCAYRVKRSTVDQILARSEQAQEVA